MILRYFYWPLRQIRTTSASSVLDSRGNYVRRRRVEHEVLLAAVRATDTVLTILLDVILILKKRFFYV